MKTQFNFYKSWYSTFRLIDIFPIFSFTKNVQGYSFVRVYSLKWFTYAFSFFSIKRSYLNEDRSVAHKKNVNRFLK